MTGQRMRFFVLLALCCLFSDAAFRGFTKPTVRTASFSATSAQQAQPNVALATKPQTTPLLSILPAAAYASLGGITLAAVHLVQPVLAWQGVALVVGSIGLPIVAVGSQLLMYGGSGIAKSMGGTELSASSRLVRLAQSAADAVGAPAPKHVYLLDKREPNAFAAGLRASDTTVAVTKGLDDILNDDEMLAVLAHEMGHLHHSDVQRNMHVAVAAVGLGGIYEAGRLLLRSSDRKSKKDDESSGAGLGLTLMAAGLGSQAVAHLLRLGASRSAELRADRAAAAAFGAEPMISALNKIERHAKHSDLRSSAAGRQMAFAMISDGPSPPEPTPTKRRGWFGKLADGVGGMLRTHPRVDERVAALKSLADTGAVQRRKSSWDRGVL